MYPDEKDASMYKDLLHCKSGEWHNDRRSNEAAGVDRIQTKEYGRQDTNNMQVKTRQPNSDDDKIIVVNWYGPTDPEVSLRTSCV